MLLSKSGSTWEETFPQWLALLDDPLNFVRGCAARMLGECSGSETRPGENELFEIMKSKEIERPGIAGPFWSDFHFGYAGPVNAVEWMLDILERRNGPEPAEMPFNGIDFYLHELCDSNPAAILRMIAAGRQDVALMTATERQENVPGMEPILQKLAADPDVEIATAATKHLQRYYHS